MKRIFLRMLSCVIILVLMLSTAPMMSISAGGMDIKETEDGLTYYINNGEAIIYYTQLYSTERLEIPEEIEGCPVTTISPFAFSEYGQSLKEISLPDTITNVGWGAFYGTAYYNDKSNWNNGVLYIDHVLIEADKSISGDCSIKEGTKVIAANAFAHCKGLETVSIPDCIEHIGPSAFEGTALFNNESNWEEGVLYADSALISAKSTLAGDYTIKSGTTVIADFAFNNCTDLESVFIPESVVTIGSSAFSGCESLNRATISDGIKYIMDYAFSHSGLISISLPDSIEYIGDSAFKNCKFLINSELPDKLQRISDSMFLWCTELQSVTLPKNTIIIGDNAFYTCSNLKNINIPNSVTSIGYAAFCDCTSLKDLTIPPNLTTIEAKTFSNTLVSEIIIPEYVTSIGNYAFHGCTELSSIRIPDSVTYVDKSAFNETKYFNDEKNWKNGILQIDSVLVSAKDIPGNTLKINNSTRVIACAAFSDCESLENLYISDSVISICGSLFDRRSHDLKSITVDRNNTVYDSRNNCRAIIETATNKLICGSQNTTIPDSVTGIGYYAFRYLDNYYHDHKDEDGVIYIDAALIDTEDLSGDYTIKEGTTVIADYAFSGNENLTSITLPESIKHIGDYAFDSNYSLTDVYFEGSQKQWAAIKIGEENEHLTDAEIHFAKEMEFITDENTNISVSTDTDATLTVSEVAKDKIKDIVETLENENEIRIFDISLQKNGTEVQPVDIVFVRIPADHPDSVVYRVESDGTLTDMDAVYKDGFLEFMTDHFSLYIVSEPTFILGDSDCNKTLNIRDATAIQKHIAGIITLSDSGLKAADVNADNNVNVRDATTIQKHIAGIYTGFLT